MGIFWVFMVQIASHRILSKNPGENPASLFLNIRRLASGLGHQKPIYWAKYNGKILALAFLDFYGF